MTPRLRRPRIERTQTRTIATHKPDGPKITDWIQAAAVTIGIAFGLWQFVLQDREQTRAKRQAVRDLILAAQNESVQSAAALTYQILSKEIEPSEIDGASWKVLPYVSYVDAWAFCIKHDLCERDLALAFACADFAARKQLAGVPFRQGKATLFHSEREFYRDLYQLCGPHWQK